MEIEAPVLVFGQQLGGKKGRNRSCMRRRYGEGEGLMPSNKAAGPGSNGMGHRRDEKKEESWAVNSDLPSPSSPQGSELRELVERLRHA